MRLNKIASLLLSVSFMNVVYTQNAIFTITPLNSKGSLVKVGAYFNAPFQLIWSVLNNTSRTEMVDDGFGHIFVAGAGTSPQIAAHYL